MTLAKRTAQHKRYVEAYGAIEEIHVGFYETPGQACYVVKELNTKYQPWMFEKPMTEQLKKQRERAKRRAEAKPKVKKGVVQPSTKRRRVEHGNGYPHNAFVVFGRDGLIRTRS